MVESPSESLKEIGEQNRKRMVEKFSVDQCGEKNLSVLLELISRGTK
jgi:hypothetical protein